jgi:hypothetical protein
MRIFVIYAFFEVFDRVLEVAQVYIVNTLNKEIVRVLAEGVGTLLLKHQNLEPEWVKISLHVEIIEIKFTVFSYFCISVIDHLSWHLFVSVEVGFRSQHRVHFLLRLENLTKFIRNYMVSDKHVVLR